MIGVVVGCKADLSADRKVSKEKAQELAIRHQARYVEVSALTGAGVEELFQSLTKSMVSRHQGWQRESLIQEPATNRIRKISQAVGLPPDSKVLTTLQRYLGISRLLDEAVFQVYLHRSKTLTASWRNRRRKTSSTLPRKKEAKNVNFVKSNSLDEAEIQVMTPLSEDPEQPPAAAAAGNTELEQKTCQCCVIS